jgi:hypothetical protein
MQKSKARVALVGAALITLGVIGAGAVIAAPAQRATAATTAAAGAAKPAALGPFERIGRQVVHGTVVVQRKDGTFVTLQLDRGAVASIGAGTMTISEAGGRTETVATDADTRVRKAGAKSDLSKLVVGDKVRVVSEVRDSVAVARMILVQRPRPAQLPAPTH